MVKMNGSRSGRMGENGYEWVKVRMVGEGEDGENGPAPGQAAEPPPWEVGAFLFALDFVAAWFALLDRVTGGEIDDDLDYKIFELKPANVHILTYQYIEQRII